MSELLDKLEIVVVNDGSTDRTPEIAQEYCSQYPETIRLVSQENKGHGGALNTGCAAAKGKFIKVIDADDWVVSESLGPFLDFLERSSADVVLTHYRTVDIGTGKIQNWRTYPNIFGVEYTFDQILTDWKKFERCLTFHGITYRRDFYQKNCVQLLEHVFYEDHQYATYPCCFAGTIVPVDLFLYVYRIGDVAQSVSVQNQCKRIGHMEAVLKGMMAPLAAMPEGGGKRFAAMKIRSLMMNYFSTAFLAYPDRAEGRTLGSRMMQLCAEAAPQVAALSRKKYRIFFAMNCLHLTYEMWTMFLHSGLYRLLQKSYDFE